MKLLDLNQMKYIREGSRTRNKIVTLSEKKMKKEDYISCLQNNVSKSKIRFIVKTRFFFVFGCEQKVK